MVVFTFIGDNEHGWVFQRSLDMLPGWATSHTATLVVSSGYIDTNRCQLTDISFLDQRFLVTFQYQNNAHFQILCLEFQFSSLNYSAHTT